MLKRSSEEHILGRADYYKGLVTKTTDPVHWSKEDLLEAETALGAVTREEHRKRYENARAMVESACHKASH
jgi:hypothetical protein